MLLEASTNAEKPTGVGEHSGQLLKTKITGTSEDLHLELGS